MEVVGKCSVDISTLGRQTIRGLGGGAIAIMERGHSGSHRKMRQLGWLQ